MRYRRIRSGNIRPPVQLQGRRLALLNEAASVLASSLDYQATLERVAHLAIPALADWCIVDTVEEGGTLHRLVVVHADPARAGLAPELRECYPPDPAAAYGVAHLIRSRAIPRTAVPRAPPVGVRPPPREAGQTGYAPADPGAGPELIRSCLPPKPGCRGLPHPPQP